MCAWRVAARTRRRQNALNHPNATLQTCPRRPVGKPAARVQMGPAARPARTTTHTPPMLLGQVRSLPVGMRGRSAL